MFDEQPDGDVHGECAAEIHRLDAEVKRLTAALHEVVFAARTKISMKDVARKALFYQPQGVTNASSDPPIK